MTKYARIDFNTNKCVEFIDFNPIGRFHPDVKWIEVPKEFESLVDNKYIVDEGGIIKPPSIDYLKTQLKEKLAKHRYSRETGGTTTPDGINIKTDRSSQSMVTSVYQSLSSELVSTADWKSPEGWITVTLSELKPIAKATVEHVERCFSTERKLCDKLDSMSAIEDLLNFNKKITDEFESTYAE